MKNKTILYLGLFLLALLLGGSIFRGVRFQKLEGKVKKSGILPTEIQVEDSALSVTGESVVFYQVTSKEYPNLSVRRIQILDEESIFKVSLQGIQGSLIKYYQQTDPYDFKYQLQAYNPLKELMLKPLISLAVLDEDLSDMNMFLKASVTAPNQITVEIEITKGYEKKARFVSKFTPQPKLSMVQQLKNKKLAFRIDYFSPDWKEKLDNYCLSKNVPFFLEDAIFEFSF